MSSLGNTAPGKSSKDDAEYPGEIGLSRWAPGGLEDQMAAKEKAVNLPTNSLNNSRWAADTTATNPTSSDKQNNNKAKNNLSKMTTEKNTKVDDTKVDDIKSSDTKTRIIGPLTEEEKAVKLENPFLARPRTRALETLAGQRSESTGVTRVGLSRKRTRSS